MNTFGNSEAIKAQSDKQNEIKDETNSVQEQMEKKGDDSKLPIVPMLIPNLEDQAEIKEEKDFKIEDSILLKNVEMYTMDLSLPLHVRLVSFERLKDLDLPELYRIVTKLISMYEMSGVKLLRSYISDICRKANIPSFAKALLANSLFSHNNNDELAFETMNSVYPEMNQDKTVNTTYKIGFLKNLMLNSKYNEQTLKYFLEFINNMNLDVKFRYKLILGLESQSEIEEDKEVKEDKGNTFKKSPNTMDYFILHSLKDFFNNNNNQINYRILSAQYFLTKTRKTEDIVQLQSRKDILEKMLTFVEDTNVEYNLRADACDVLLQYSTDAIKTRATQLILELGKIGSKGGKTIFDNAQNVHTKEIEESVNQVLEYLHSFDIMKNEKYEQITVNDIEANLFSFIKEQKTTFPVEDEMIRISFNRIRMDKALYGKYNCNLSHILLRLWTYICTHENGDDIKKRLVEELSEMAGTCSSGFASRLVNTISGFGNFGLKISWRDQIIANLKGRLNARIRNMDNLRLQERILNEMSLRNTIENVSLQRRNFLSFMREQLPSIREEMHTEFVNYISSTDFDLYFRSAIGMYENGEMI